MDLIRKIMFGIGLLAMLVVNLGFGATQIKTGVCELVGMVNAILGAVIFVLIVVAAVVYAAGQVMGAETRARASVWATSMIVGAIIGIIIFVLVPPVLGSMVGIPMTAGMTKEQCIGLSVPTR